MRKSIIVMRVMQCPECGTTQLFSKRAGKNTGIGHIKTAYCGLCKKDVDYVQIGIERI